MGIKRVVDVDFWKDEDIELYTPEEKYFRLFLLTNPFTTQCGIYRITKKEISFFTGYDVETCSKLLERFENNYKIIKRIDNEIAIRNNLKFSIVKGGLPIKQQIERELSKVKNKELVKWIFDELEEEREKLTPTILDILNNKYKYINANANAHTGHCTDERTLKGRYKKVDVKPNYDNSNNPQIDNDKLDKILKERDK